MTNQQKASWTQSVFWTGAVCVVCVVCVCVRTWGVCVCVCVCMWWVCVAILEGPPNGSTSF